MGQTWGVYPCIGTRFIGEKSVIFWPTSMIFFAKFDEILHEMSGGHYLSILRKNLWVWC